MNDDLLNEFKIKIIQIYIYEIGNRDFIENEIMNYMIQNMYDSSKLEYLLKYLISQISPNNQLFDSSQFQNNPNTYTNAMINPSHISQTQPNTNESNSQVNTQPIEYKYPAYIFQKYKNIKHIKVAYFINEDIYQQTNHHCLHFFEKNKRNLIN